MYRVIIEPQQPLLFGTPAMGNYRSSLPYIPGANLRGAVASQIERTFGKDAYLDLFQHQDSIFFSAYPSQSADGVELPRFFPISAMTCKRFPGIEPPGSPSEKHGVWDTFLENYRHHRSFQGNGNENPFLPVCPECSADVRPHLGIIQGDYQDGLSLLRSTSTTHVGISRKRRVASDGFLYTRVGITAREDSVVYFIGLAILPDEIAAMFEPENDLVLHVGANRHRGMGRIHLWIESWEEPRHWHTAIERADHITSLLDSDSQEKYFTLDTLTPWVPDPFTSHTHPLEGLPAELVFSTTKAEVLTGWHQESGLPRRSYPGVMGTFLYRTSSSELISELHLAQLGLEQDRGYGLMMVCDPYHYERTEIS